MASPQSDPGRAGAIFLQTGVAAALLAGVACPCLYGWDLISQPILGIRCVLAVVTPVTLLAYSTPPLRRPSLPRWRAVIRGLVALPIGTLLAAFVGLLFGAPLNLEAVPSTLHWAALISVLTVMPAACVLGSTWHRWRQVFASISPSGVAETAVCMAAHGALLGAWLGAIPMPLDWEQPWQEWPICCTMGTIGGYVVGTLVGCMSISSQTFEVPAKKD